MRQLLPGLLFAALWASASAATKFGLQVADPFVLATVRFFIAGSLMLSYAYILKPSQHRLPKGKEWKHLIVFSLMNTTIYLGAFVLAMQSVSAGIGSLSVATSPLFITILSAVWLKRRLKWFELFGLILGLLGVGIATYPLLHNSFASVHGLLILLAGMISVSAATVYYAGIKWQLPNVVINGWQVLFGGVMLLPFCIMFSKNISDVFSLQFMSAVSWLIIPVSIGALQLWFYLVKIDPVRASLWLFLCPIFGFVYAALLFNEPITIYTFVGTFLVIGGLYAARQKQNNAKT